jgi:hypothetical protein
MAFVKCHFILEPKEHLVLTAVREVNAVQDIEKDPIGGGGGGIAAVW